MAKYYLHIRYLEREGEPEEVYALNRNLYSSLLELMKEGKSSKLSLSAKVRNIIDNMKNNKVDMSMIDDAYVSDYTTLKIKKDGKEEEVFVTLYNK